MSWFVEVIDNDGVVIKTFSCASERSAERVERGVSINLDHEKYSTRIVSRATP